MDSPQILKFATKPAFLLALLLVVFLTKGVILSVLLPFFQGPDEQTHYATIQHHAEPRDKSWLIQERKNINKSDDITTYHLSEESIQTAVATQFDELKSQNENTQHFTNADTGAEEVKIIDNTWKRYIDTYPTNVSGTKSFYYSLGAHIEKLFSDQSILFRLFSIRMLSVMLGMIVVLLTYLTARKIDFSEWRSFAIATLVAFQPMFSASASQVNIDIALILSFSFFIYVAVSLIKTGWRFGLFALLLFSLLLGLYSKGPGIVLVVCAAPLLVFVAYKHFANIPRRIFFWGLFLGCSLVCAIAFTFMPARYLASITNLSATSQFSSPAESIGRYLDKTLSQGALRDTEASYWGNFGWLDTKISADVVRIIGIIEFISLLGLIAYLVSKRQIGYLPEKRYLIFFVGILVALQLAIRFYDWRIFDTTGRVLIGTPGRYFLPNIVPHILLIVTGLGYFTKNQRQFGILLKVLAILMILLSLYTIFDVIIPRYYL